MPTYQYACRECGEHLEAVQGFYDEPLTTCEACGGELRKVFTPAGIIFKGSGYYVTDTRAEREQAKQSKSRSTSSDGAGSSESSDGAGGSESGSAESGAKESDSKSSEPSTSGSGESESAA